MPGFLRTASNPLSWESFEASYFSGDPGLVCDFSSASKTFSSGIKFSRMRMVQHHAFRAKNCIKNTLPTQSFVFAFISKKAPLVVENRKDEPDMLRLKGLCFRAVLIYSRPPRNAMILNAFLTIYLPPKSVRFG